VDFDNRSALSGVYMKLEEGQLIDGQGVESVNKIDVEVALLKNGEANEDDTESHRMELTDIN
jgi:hypothetical protein